MKKLNRNVDGITLIALVISIIIMLILAGVSIGMITGENGLFGQTKKAVKSYDTASEMEALSLSVVNYNITNNEADKLGEKLSKMSTITGDWKNVIVGENTYKDGWYLVEKDNEITGYGKAKLNWLINYDTGEIIELKDGEYTIASANASGAIVDETLKLNIDPSNMQDESQWGDGIKFVGNSGSSESGVKETEIKFDGVDDFLELENVEIEESDGFTFEFYVKNYENEIYPLEKTILDKNDKNYSNYINNFRTILGEKSFRCCFSSKQSKSDKADVGAKGEHWLYFNEIGWSNSENFNYMTIKVDFINNIVKLYSNGKPIVATTCDHEYLRGASILDNKIPFTIGLMVDGTRRK